jgi:hypothetical protein
MEKMVEYAAKNLEWIPAAWDSVFWETLVSLF